MFHMDEDAGTLLNLLGNGTRRKIIAILSNEPKYFIQLSKELGVSQQAVLKHLALLEEYGLVSSFRAKSNFAAPDRKYFRLSKPVYLSVGITEDSMHMDLKNLDDENVVRSDNKKNFRKIIQKSKNIENKSEMSIVVNEVNSIIRTINARIEQLEEEKMELLRLKQQATQKVHEVIRETLEEDLTRRILYSILTSSSRLDVTDLSEILNIREKEIKEAMKELENKFSINLKYFYSET